MEAATYNQGGSHAPAQDAGNFVFVEFSVEVGTHWEFRHGIFVTSALDRANNGAASHADGVRF